MADPCLVSQTGELVDDDTHGEVSPLALTPTSPRPLRPLRFKLLPKDNI